jgi:ketosteroid isomerase-like protein
MRLDQLNGVLAFITVAERHRFSAAARALRVSRNGEIVLVRDYMDSLAMTRTLGALRA